VTELDESSAERLADAGDDRNADTHARVPLKVGASQESQRPGSASSRLTGGVPGPGRVN
jgi:hypothetical protein